MRIHFIKPIFFLVLLHGLPQSSRCGNGNSSPEDLAKNLLDAVRNDNSEKVQNLLKQNADPNTLVDEDHKTTLLMHAVREQYLEVVQILLDHKDIDVNATNNLNETAVMIGFELSVDTEILKALLKHTNTRLDIKGGLSSRDGFYFFEEYCNSSVLFDVSEADLEDLKKLVDAKRDRKKETIPLSDQDKKDMDTIADKPNEKEIAPLSNQVPNPNAIKNQPNQKKKIQAATDQATLDQQLIEAVEKKEGAEKIKNLLDLGADPNVSFEVKWGIPYGKVQTPLLVDAVHKDNLNAVKVLLADTRTDVNATNDIGWTPMYRAFLGGRSVEIMYALAKHPKTNPYIKDKEGYNVFDADGFKKLDKKAKEEGDTEAEEICDLVRNKKQSDFPPQDSLSERQIGGIVIIIIAVVSGLIFLVYKNHKSRRTSPKRTSSK